MRSRRPAPRLRTTPPPGLRTPPGRVPTQRRSRRRPPRCRSCCCCCCSRPKWARAPPFPPRTASAALPAPRSERPPAAAEACAAGSIRAASVPSVGKSAGGAYEGTAAVESGEVEPPPQALKARPDEPGVTRAHRSPSLPPPTSAAGADGAELLLGTGPGPGAGALAAADTGTAADGASGGLAPLAAIRARVAHGVSTAPSSFGGPAPQAGLAPAGAGGRAPPAGEARPEPPAVITSADGGLAAG